LVYPTDVGAEVISSRIRALLPVDNAPTIVVLDHITSETGVLLPVSEIVASLRATHPHIRFVIDAAHSAGMLEQPLPVGFDVWVGNLHKWLCAPRPAGALICGSDEIAALMNPLAPSWGFDKGFPSSFEWQGTSDYSAYLCVPAAITFQEQWSWAERNTHNCEVADGAASLLRAAWGVENHLVGAIEAPWMRMIQLPTTAPLEKSQIDSLIERCGIELNAECAFMTVRGNSYVRISAHMYNEIDQYEVLAGLTQLLP